MGDHSHGSPNTSGTVATAGQGVEGEFQNPGLPPHRPRLADTDPRAEKRAEKQVAILFAISVIGTLLFFYAYFFIRLDEPIGTLRVQNLFLGLGMIALGAALSRRRVTPTGHDDIVGGRPRGTH